MVLGSMLLTTNDAITKWLTQEYPVSQVWCLRTVFVLVLIILLAPRYGGYRALLPNRIPAQLLRAVLFFSTTLLIVTGLSLLRWPRWSRSFSVVRFSLRHWRPFFYASVLTVSAGW